MKVIYKKPMLDQVRCEIRRNKHHDPEIDHINFTQSEWLELLRDLRNLSNSNEPSDTADHVFVDGVCCRQRF